MTYGSIAEVEREAGVALVVFIGGLGVEWRRGAVGERPGLLHIWDCCWNGGCVASTPYGGRGAGCSREVIDSVEHDDVRCVGRGRVCEGAVGDVGVEFWGCEGGEVGGVGGWD